MCNFERLHGVILDELGECGYEAIQTAIEFYLANAGVDDFGCEEDKVFLLMFLLSARDSFTISDYNPLHHFHISIDCKKWRSQEVDE